MLIRSRSLVLPLLLLFGGVLSGCAGPPVFDEPTGVAYLDRVLAFLANPNVAYLLLVLGLLALIAEFATPGASVPGALGAIMLALSLYGLLRLPTNWLGPVLILTGVILLLVDIKVTGIALNDVGDGRTERVMDGTMTVTDELSPMAQSGWGTTLDKLEGLLAGS